jgi:hypothetical protein
MSATISIKSGPALSGDPVWNGDCGSYSIDPRESLSVRFFPFREVSVLGEGETKCRPQVIVGLSDELASVVLDN